LVAQGIEAAAGTAGWGIVAAVEFTSTLVVAHLAQ
jgi:hypothetical protein